MILVLVGGFGRRCSDEGFDGVIGATIIRVAGGRVREAFGTLLVLAAVGNRGEKGVIVVVHHSGRCFSLYLVFPRHEYVHGVKCFRWVSRNRC